MSWATAAFRLPGPSWVLLLSCVTASSGHRMLPCGRTSTGVACSLGWATSPSSLKPNQKTETKQNQTSLPVDYRAHDEGTDGVVSCTMKILHRFERSLQQNRICNLTFCLLPGFVRFPHDVRFFRFVRGVMTLSFMPTRPDAPHVGFSGLLQISVVSPARCSFFQTFSS